jgi:hypothetical protein
MFVRKLPKMLPNPFVVKINPWLLCTVEKVAKNLGHIGNLRTHSKPSPIGQKSGHTDGMYITTRAALYVKVIFFSRLWLKAERPDWANFIGQWVTVCFWVYFFRFQK